MAVDLKSIQDEITAAFSLEDSCDWHLTRGVMALPISGQFLWSMNASAVIAAIRFVMPPDAKIYAPDGLVLRLRGGSWGYGSDEYALIVTSAEYSLIEEGAEFPLLRPIYYGEAPMEKREEDAPQVTQVHSLYGSHLDIHEFIINKTTHIIEIPKDRETEDRMVIVVKPKG